MYKKLLLLCLFIPTTLISYRYKIGKFNKSKKIQRPFKIIGSVPSNVKGGFTLKAKTAFKKIFVSYDRPSQNRDFRKRKKQNIIITATRGYIRQRIQLAFGKGKYHFAMWGKPSVTKKGFSYIGSFNVMNTSNKITAKIKTYTSRLSLDDSVYNIKSSINGHFRLKGRTSDHFLMIWVKKGRLRAKSTIPVKKSRFNFPVYLRFGRGEYKIYLFSAGKRGMGFSSRGLITIKNSGTRDLRFTAPSPDIQSYHPAIRRLAKKITKGKRGTMAKTRALYRWVTRNIRYDYESFRKMILRHRSAINVLKDKKAVCTGYSFLFAALLRAEKIPVRIISGTALSRYFGNRWIPHAWNQVKIGRRWINADATWDASTLTRRGAKGKLVFRPWRHFAAPAYKFNSRHRMRKVLLK